MKNKYPIFIPTKGRYETPITINMFKSMNVDFTIVVEPQEFKEYSKIVDQKHILITPHENKGLTETRNFIWDYAESKGFEKFWTFDDNIGRVYRLNNNRRLQVKDGTFLRVIEDFADRYENLPLIGMNYVSFCKDRDKLPAFYMNTRVYSNMLLETNARFTNGEKVRNKLFYNDDTDLCLRLMKDGFPIVQINAFLIDKGTTMQLKGGMTDYYTSPECEGRKAFVEELKQAHPEIVELTWKFNRWHHQVNYKPFKRNKLIRKQDIEVQTGINEYGMKLKTN